MMEVAPYGKLLIQGKNGKYDLEFPLDKRCVLVGRDNECDIRITNKEISRKHMELFIEDNGAVFISSLGREPVSVNGQPVLSPMELSTGDKIEVHLEGRTRQFLFHGNQDTVVLGGNNRQPLSALNAETAAAPVSAKKAPDSDAARMPPPPPKVTSQPEEALPFALEKTVAIPDLGDFPEDEDMLAEEKKTDEGAGEELQHTAPLDAEEEEVLAAAANEEEGESEARDVAAKLAAKMISNALAAAKTPAKTPAAAPPSTAQKTKKSVRFTAAVEGTPEGVARDVTMVLPFNMDGERAMDINADSTMAFAQWAQGSYGLGDGEGTPAGAGSARSARRSSSSVPKSAGKTPMAVPLAAKLAELAEAHDVTFELPADFMRWTPGPATAAKMTIGVVGAGLHASANASNAAGTPGSVFVTGAVDAAVTALASKLADIAEEHNVEFELPAGFMSWTPLPPTVVKQPLQAAPRSALRSAGKARTPLLPPASASKATRTPATAPRGEQAPAPTPTTAVPSAVKSSIKESSEAEASALATKLAKLAEVHDVTFELPVDFMRWTPAVKKSTATPAGAGTATKAAAVNPTTEAKELAAATVAITPATGAKGGTTVAITPATAAKAKSAAITPGKGMTPGMPGIRAPAPTPCAAPAPGALDASSLAAKLAELAEEHDVEFELPADFMKWTPAAKKAMSIAVTPRTAVRSSVAKSMAAATPKTTGGAVPASAAKNQPSVRSHSMFKRQEEVQQEAVPASSARESTGRRRRSSIRTPGTKIAIIGGIPTSAGGYSSVKPARTPREATVPLKQEVEMAEQELEQPPVEGSADAGDVEMEMVEATADVPSTMGIDDSAGEHAVGGEEEEVEQEDGEEVVMTGAENAPTVARAKYQQMVLQAKLERGRAVQLAQQVRGLEARALRLKRAATNLHVALEEEKAKRQELQAVLQQIAANREAEEEDEENAAEDAATEEVADEAMEVDSAEDAPILCIPRVVVVGCAPSVEPSRTELAGSVVVVRPAAAAAKTPAKPPVKALTPKAKTPVTVKKTPATSRKSQSARKASGTTPSGGKLIDEVEVPGWVFDKAAGAPADVSADLAEVVAVAEDAAVEKPVLAKKKVEEAVVAEIEESESEDEGEEEEGEDKCHKCHTGEEGDVLLLCDGCDNACHLACCDPPLKRVPKGDWYCTECKSKKAEEAAAAAAAKKKATVGRGKKRAVAEEKEEEPTPAPKPAAKRGAKKAAAATAPSPSATGSKRTRGGAAAPADEEAPTAKRTRGRPAASATKAAGAAEPATRSTRSRR